VNKSKELENCNFVKLLLTLSVVLYHSVAYWKGGWFYKEPSEPSEILRYIAIWLNTFHIYGFVIVSGYIFQAMKNERNQYQNYIAFLINKARRLIVPLCFTSLVWAAPFYKIFFKPTVQVLVKKFVLMESPSQLWFLGMLFVVFTLYWPISSFVNRNWVAGGVLALFAYCAGLAGSKFFPNVFQVWTGMKYLIFFYTGCYLRKSENKFLYKLPSWLYLLLDAALFTSWIYIDGLNIKVLTVGWNLVLCMAGGVSAFIIFQRIAQQTIVEKSWAKFGCKHGMTIYLFHQQIIYVTLFLLDGCVNPYLMVLVNLVGSIVVSSLISIIADRFPIMRFLTTGR
jgi:hypothetical protein